MNVNYEKLACLLKDYRLLHQLSQLEMAMKIEIDQSYFSRIEHAQQNISLNLLIRIANVLNIPPWNLLSYLCNELDRQYYNDIFTRYICQNSRK